MTAIFTIEHEQVLRTDLSNSEIRYKKFMYFPDRGCVRTLRTFYGYATDSSIRTRTPNNKAVHSQGELRDAAINFDMYRILQRHRAVSLPQHGFFDAVG